MGLLCWYSGPWPVFPAFPAVRDLNLCFLSYNVKKNVDSYHKQAYKKITLRKTARYGAAPCP